MTARTKQRDNIVNFLSEKCSDFRENKGVLTFRELFFYETKVPLIFQDVIKCPFANVSRYYVISSGLWHEDTGNPLQIARFSAVCHSVTTT